MASALNKTGRIEESVRRNPAVALGAASPFFASDSTACPTETFFGVLGGVELPMATHSSLAIWGRIELYSWHCSRSLTAPNPSVLPSSRLTNIAHDSLGSMRQRL